MGKTQSGAVWLDPAKTSPYDFYQYWRNVDDKDVLKCLRMLTFLPIEQINEMDTWEGSRLNEAKDILAYELTALVHGTEEAERARSASRALFGQGDASEMPTVTLTEEDLQGGSADLITLLVKSGLVPSRSEGRRAIEQGGVTVGDEKITDTKKTYTADELRAGVVVRRGKKSFKRIVL
jgi:tyrosyl-tRNA synthetase